MMRFMRSAKKETGYYPDGILSGENMEYLRAGERISNAIYFIDTCKIVQKAVHRTGINWEIGKIDGVLSTLRVLY